MATRRNETDNVNKKKAAPAKKAAARKATLPAQGPAAKKAQAPRKAPAPDAVPSALPDAVPDTKPDTKPANKGLLHAGLKALGSVRDDVVLRQGNVIESLLGITQGKKGEPPRFPGLEPFGIRKFEDVFDQRVASALQRLGMPGAKEFEELREQMKLLLELLQRDEASRRKR
ncbi:poly granule associated family protein [Variovorax sp. J22R133]|uniref:poly granule associated family protein n=1 Tax=Variovorax brevis TaxID=3053503 RepID=UPI002577F1B6|nr:poly granule associated family protein [Variovorax sp. J22R133]MDM0111897.1 poly granule associated family protein [Variovorax sp. J22R133]